MHAFIIRKDWSMVNDPYNGNKVHVDNLGKGYHAFACTHTYLFTLYSNCVGYCVSIVIELQHILNLHHYW